MKKNLEFVKTLYVKTKEKKVIWKKCTSDDFERLNLYRNEKNFCDAIYLDSFKTQLEEVTVILTREFYKNSQVINSTRLKTPWNLMYLIPSSNRVYVHYNKVNLGDDTILERLFKLIISDGIDEDSLLDKMMGVLNK